MALDVAKLRAPQPPARLASSAYARPASEWKAIRTLEAVVANPVVGQNIE